MTLKVRRFGCAQCDRYLDELKWNYDAPPDCPDGHGPMREVSKVASFGNSANVIQDSIPGGLMIEHGICNEDGTPKRYDSKREIREAARKAGWTQGGDTPQPREKRWI